MLAGAELVIDEPMADRGRRMLEALADCGKAEVTPNYRGRHRLLVIYGVGLPRRMSIRRQHLASGGRVAMWDLGYWDRSDALRVAIDSFHPTAEQLAAAPVGNRHPVTLREDADPSGPILLVGLGPKSAVMLEQQPGAWERAKLDELRRRFPGRRILWRPKGTAPTSMPGTKTIHGNAIEDAIRGCSLVVCRHSNVAIDACIAGVPVECEDGAARALYRNGSSPTREQRAEFLRRLSFWNWKPGEADLAWNWMETMTESIECV